jgi:hypothetical protein
MLRLVTTNPRLIELALQRENVGIIPQSIPSRLFSFLWRRA